MEQSNFKVTKENYKDLIGKIEVTNLINGKMYAKIETIDAIRYPYIFLAKCTRVVIYNSGSCVITQKVDRIITLNMEYEVLNEFEVVKMIDNLAKKLKEIIK